jgi:xanthine/uracil permease
VFKALILTFKNESGLVDFTQVQNASWFALPKVLRWGLEMPNISSLVLICVLYIVTTVETIGYISATCDAVGVKADEKRVRGGVLGDALGSIVGGALGSTPLTAYAQNVEAISITRVGSRHIILWTGLILVILGLVPKFSALVGTIPNPVLGGAILVLFGMVAGVGVQNVRESITGNRELLIFSISLSLGLGFSLVNEKALAFLPIDLVTALKTGVGIGAVSAIVVNIILPKKNVIDVQTEQSQVTGV